MYWIGGIIASLIGLYFGYRRGKEVGFILGWNKCADRMKREGEKENNV